MNKKWELFNTDKKLVEKVKNEFNLSELLATCLVNRGIVDTNDLRIFLEPTRNDFHDPFLMPDMDKATSRYAKSS